MRFTDRAQAGQLLAEKLKKYEGKDVIIYALPRGGVVTALKIAQSLHAPLDIIITRKISHPLNSEYAIAAITENGHLIGKESELTQVDRYWLQKKIAAEQHEAKRRRKAYVQGGKILSPKNKIAILVDDGVATGFTIRAGIYELRQHTPAKIIVAIPVISETIAHLLKQEADELIAVEIPPDGTFLGAVGAYYENFSQIEDKEVIDILRRYHHDYSP